MSDTPPSRPAWCLEKAREWLQTHGLWWVSAGKEELLANLLDDAYLRGLHEERRRAGMAQLQTWTCVDCGETHPINHAGRFTAEGMSCCESDRSRPEGVSGGSTGAELEAATELETELDATRSELEGIKEPFCQLMKRLRVVDGAEDVESPYTRVLARVTLRLWNQLRNAYEATLPPVDHSWLDEVNKEEDKEEGAD